MLLAQSAPGCWGASGYWEKEKSTAPSGDQWRCLCPRQGIGSFLVIEAGVQLKITTYWEKKQWEASWYWSKSPIRQWKEWASSIRTGIWAYHSGPEDTVYRELWCRLICKQHTLAQRYSWSLLRRRNHAAHFDSMDKAAAAAITRAGKWLNLWPRWEKPAVPMAVERCVYNYLGYEKWG